jgi:hypothetical protein
VLEADGRGHWLADGRPAPTLEGCIDVDLAATPFTNTLPIRRLALAPGDEARVLAVWVGAPGLDLEVLDQRYRRLEPAGGLDRYRYTVPRSAFEAELSVDDEGLVHHYAGLARRVAAY